MRLSVESPAEDLVYFGEWNNIPVLHNLFWYHPRVNKRMLERFGTRRCASIVVIANKEYLFLSKTWLSELRKEILLSDSKKLKAQLLLFYPEFDRVKTFLLGKIDTNWSEKSDAALAGEFHRVFVEINNITGFDQYCMIGEQFYLEGLENFLREQLRKTPEKINECRAVLTTPVRQSATQAQELALLQMAQTLKAGAPMASLENEIHAYVHAHGWLPVFLTGAPWDSAFVRAELNELSKRNDLAARERQITDYAKNTLFATQKILASFDSSSAWPELMQEVGFIRNEGETLISLGTFVLRPAYSEIAKRLGVSQNDLFCLSGEEIVELLKTKKRMDAEIRKRVDKGAVFFADPEDLQIVSGDEALAFFNRVYQRPKPEQSKGLSGMCASLGSARGTVRIVRTVDDLPRFAEGDVLVAEATCIDYVPIMRKAAAVVTEMGGITSHASIVSREFGIPCVVGVTNATRILKEGQTVRVDGTNGTISVLD